MQSCGDSRAPLVGIRLRAENFLYQSKLGFKDGDTGERNHVRHEDAERPRLLGWPAAVPESLSGRPGAR
jgi:hypothetical protein